MARKTKVISISVPEELDRMAEEEGFPKSELVRLMARSYRRERAEEWHILSNPALPNSGSNPSKFNSGACLVG